MYNYTEFDKDFVRTRVEEFRAQTALRLSGVLTEDEYKPLRLQNGLYLQLHAYMLRIAIPYGTLSAHQMRGLADIAERFDKGYGHFTTRQNIQFNWIKLEEVADILAALADVDMHAIQTSGNCIRNVTADHFAGAAADEVADPRITAELVRQWSTGHPEFAFLPRKFKIAVSGSVADRAVIAFHDIGVQVVRNAAGELGYRILVGGGLGRTPLIASELRAFLPKSDLLAYLEAVLHVYNRLGRRDNKYKARIKILIQEYGLEKAKADIEAYFEEIRSDVPPPPADLMANITAGFLAPYDEAEAASDLSFERKLSPAFTSWLDTNTHPHRHDGHAIVSISLKAVGATPGDATAAQMRALADLAQAYGYDELRVSHEQNIILPHVPKRHLPKLYEALIKAGLATANIGLLSDIIACPGMDYCALATARSIPIAIDIATRFDALKQERDIGPLKIKISGCINACGHHHVGHIGILGLDRGGVENYQITLGGDGSEDAHIGTRTGPGFSAEALLPAIETILDVYLDGRFDSKERFIAFYRRVGMTPFRASLYPAKKNYRKKAVA